MKFLVNLKKKIKSFLESIREIFSKDRHPPESNGESKDGEIKAKNEKLVDKNVRIQQEKTGVEEKPFYAPKNPKKYMSPSIKKLWSEMEEKDNKFDKKPQVNIEEDERTVKSTPRFKNGAQLFLDLSFGCIKLISPVIYFPSIEDYNLASPIKYSIEILSSDNILKYEEIKIGKENCKIGESEAKPISIEVGLFKSVSYKIESSNQGLTKEDRIENNDLNYYIFQEKMNLNPFVKDLNKKFKKNDFIWILLEENMVIKPNPQIGSQYISYNGYKLCCVSFTKGIRDIQIFNSENVLINSLYQAPEILLIHGNSIVRDDFFVEEPILNSNFKIKIECSDKLLAYPKLLHIRNSKKKKKESQETDDFHCVFELNENYFEILPKYLDHTIGYYQINVEFYADEQYKERILNSSTRFFFRYCPIEISRSFELFFPTSIENNLKYPIDIKCLNAGEIKATSEQCELIQSFDDKGVECYKTEISSDMDVIKIWVASRVETDKILIKISIPWIKWRLDGLELKEDFSGECIEVLYEEESLFNNKFYLEIKNFSHSRIDDLSLEVVNDSYPIFNYIKKTSTFNFPLEIISDIIHRNMKKNDSFYISIYCNGHRFPILRFFRELINESETPSHKISYNPPRIILDNNEGCVKLVIPEQKLILRNPPVNIEYLIKINENVFSLKAKVSEIDTNYFKVEKIEQKLKTPLESYEIEYPMIYNKKKLLYNHIHKDRNVYLFNLPKNSKSRMVKLWDDFGFPNEIDKKQYIVLHPKSFETEPSHKKIDELNIWDYNYPKRIDLRENEYLKIKNIETNEESCIFCSTLFSLHGKKLDFDEYQSKGPLITGQKLSITSSRINSEGWCIKIRNGIGNVKILNDAWTGAEPLRINYQKDLVNKIGEYKIEIYNENSTKKIETIKFRYIHYIEVNYSKDLIIPEKIGHSKEIYQITLGENYNELKINVPHNVGSIINEDDNGIDLILNSKTDSVKFSIIRKDNPKIKTNIQIRIPRLRWRLFDDWHDKKVVIKRQEIFESDEALLEVLTNDPRQTYQIIGQLSDKVLLKQMHLKESKPFHYTCKLDALFDELKENTKELKFAIKIIDSNNNIKEEELKCFVFPEIETQSLKTPARDKQDQGEEDLEIQLEDEDLDQDSDIEDEDLGTDSEDFERPLNELTHEFIRDNPTKKSILHASKWINTKGKCKILAQELCITRAVILSETLRNFYFKDQINYGSIRFNTQINENGIKKTGIEINLIKKPTIEKFNKKLPSNEDIGMFVGHKFLDRYIFHANRVLDKKGYCKIKARGRLIPKTGKICESLKNSRNSRNSSIIYDDIVLYMENIEGNNVVAIYIKISRPKNYRNKPKQQNNPKTRSKPHPKPITGKTIQIGNSLFEI